MSHNNFVEIKRNDYWRIPPACRQGRSDLKKKNEYKQMKRDVAVFNKYIV